MTRSESATVTVSHRGSLPRDRDAEHTVVWVRGDHDIATRISLVVAIARAAQRDDADLIVDLSEVTFMDASTIGALVGSRNRLGSRSRSLWLRAPSPSARRVLELCDLAHLIHPEATGTAHRSDAAAALGTWVDVTPTGGPVHEGPLPAAARASTLQLASVTGRLVEGGSTGDVERGGP